MTPITFKAPDLMVAHEVCPCPRDYYSLPIQGVKVKIPRGGQTSGKVEENTMTHKGYAWNLLFRHDPDGFILPMQ